MGQPHRGLEEPPCPGPDGSRAGVLASGSSPGSLERWQPGQMEGDGIRQHVTSSPAHQGEAAIWDRGRGGQGCRVRGVWGKPDLARGHGEPWTVEQQRGPITLATVGKPRSGEGRWGALAVPLSGSFPIQGTPRLRTSRDPQGCSLASPTHTGARLPSHPRSHLPSSSPDLGAEVRGPCRGTWCLLNLERVATSLGFSFPTCKRKTAHVPYRELGLERKQTSPLAWCWLFSASVLRIT